MAKSGKPKKTTQQGNTTQNYFDKVSQEIESNQSRLSMVLGALILLVIGILIFNYFNKSKSDLGPAQQSEQLEDVSPDNLPGKYTVKEGDTLFIIAEKYYQDGLKFELISKANNLSDVNAIESGQVLEIPKLEQIASPQPSPSETPIASPSETPTESLTASPTPESSPTTSSPQKGDQLATGGSDTTIWGPKIEGNTYTVEEGDWLSTISARAYGDIFAYTRIVEANKIQNPDYIVPGMVLNIPR